MTTADFSDFVHTGPGTLAGRYLRMFWQPVYRAQDLAPGRAVPIRIMSEDFTLFRGEGSTLRGSPSKGGTPHVVAFRCAHRGTQLSTGWVEGDSIRCRYHGWRYDGEGHCVEQPGEDEGFASKVRIRSYPTREYLGLIFASLGEGEAPPFRRYPQLEGPGVLELYTPEYWPCNYFNRIDNACDVAHISFAHRRSRLAVNELREVPILSAEETEYGVRTDVLRGTSEVASLHFLMPNTNHFRTSLSLREGRSSSSGAYLDRFLFRVPVDDENCVSFPLDFAHLTGEAAREYEVRRRQLKQATPTPHTELGEAVLEGKISMEEIENQPNLKNLTSLEDYVVQVGQGPIADRRDERIGKMDIGVFLLRKLWQRELKALAEGKPLKQWVIPEQIATRSVK